MASPGRALNAGIHPLSRSTCSAEHLGIRSALVCDHVRIGVAIMDTLTGRCLCGTITFAITGPPLQIVHCHCESCRRTTSSPATTFLIVQRVEFKHSQGTPKSYESSPGVRRSFCERCGSPLTYETDRRPDHIDVYLCSLCNPAAIVPQAHVPWKNSCRGSKFSTISPALPGHPVIAIRCGTEPAAQRSDDR